MIVFVFIIAIIGILLFIYSYFIEPANYKYREEFIVSSKINKKIRILHLSDFHLKGCSLKRLTNFMNKLSEKKPDIILISGDYSENDGIVEFIPELFECFNRKIPKISVLGNHDIYKYHFLHSFFPEIFVPVRRDVNKILMVLENIGVRVLRYEYIKFKVNGNSLCINGLEYLDYFQKEPKNDFSDFKVNNYNIVLNHTPDLISFMNEKDYTNIDLLLLGHTHGGQIRIPFHGHLVTRTKYNRRIIDGLNRIGNTFINISRGLGQSVGLRFLCNPEAVMINIDNDKK